MKNIDIKKHLLFFIIADLAVLSFGFFQNINFLISTQAGFLSSLLVTLASYHGYKKMVQNKVEIGDIPIEVEDELDKIDDKYELYQKEQDFKKIVELEKQNIKGVKSSVKNLGKSLFAVISPLRLFAYLFLILSFLYLNTHHLLDIFAFIIGISVISVVTLLLSLI